jgi:hypothetical protein
MLHGTGANEKAIAAFQKALENGVPAAYGDYGKAIAYPEMLSADEDLASLRGDEGFTQLLAQAKHYQAPCVDTAENRQFDFWIGEWDVVSTTSGTPAGNSKIELILGNLLFAPQKLACVRLPELGRVGIRAWRPSTLAV